MDHRARFSTLSASYDDFLFAPVCEDANGMRLSVLSALARMNVDPWDEAGRLAAMPKAIAEKTLLLALDRVSGRSWKSPEAMATVARLVRLLPHAHRLGTSTAPVAANALARPENARSPLTRYWWVWLALWIAMSLMVPHPQQNTTNGNVVTSTPGSIIPSTSSHSIGDSAGPSR